MTIAAVVGAVVVAAAAWYWLFGLGRHDIWRRSWAVAAVVTAYSVGALVAVGRLDDVVGPAGPVELGLGVGVGLAWLVATHVGHAVLSRVLPSFRAQIEDLYGLGGEDETPWHVAGPLVAMAVAEELIFRGVIHGSAGFVAGVAVYTVVQGVERKWALVLAAVLGGIVWGGLFEATGGVLAPVVAHAIWTVTLTLVWPLRGAPRPPGGDGAGDGVSDGGTGPIRSEAHPPAKGRHA